MRLTILKGLAAGMALSVFAVNTAKAQAFSESFNDITTLAGSGWVMTNASVAVGSTNWFQGSAVSAGGPFDSYNGAANAYIGANYNNTGNVGTISNWLMTPNRTYRNGDVITFFTRKPSPDTYADRLEVRMSTNGASTSVGTGSGVGDYTTLLLSINPSLTLGVYPTTWTMYTVTISGLPAPTSGRLAFRYFVTSAGLSGTNSDYIGIDQVNYTPYVCPSFTMTPSGTLTGGTAGSAYSTSLTQTGALGAPSYAVTAGALPPGLTLSASGTISGTPTATGTFNFSVTVSDASGCSGSSAYSITVVCPANPISFSSAPTLCSNDAMYTLIQGSPAGGSYSGTGVSGGAFDPASGTQTITYDITDPYGCAHSSNYTITVNTAPTVTLAALSDVCSNDGMVGLTGESPAGGTFSGTGVTGSNFDASSGSQTITYTYTDGNGCSNSDMQPITVNTAPNVSHTDLDLCENLGTQAITGSSPAGGVYSGTGVTGSNFDVSAGTQSIDYTYTDGNGCSDMVTFTITVLNSQSATMSPISAVCSNDGIVTLTEGSPAGGTYSGTGVTGNQFDPAAGTQTITYTLQGGTQCESVATGTITVNTAPTVALTLTDDVTCINYAEFALGGGTPASGSYSGNGVSGGMFDPALAGLGSTTITYSYTDGNGCSAQATDVMNVGACAGIAESDVTIYNVYPNPSSGKFFVDNAKASQIVSITDLQGRAIEFEVSSNEFGSEILLNNQPNGVYLLQIENTSIRLIKQ